MFKKAHFYLHQPTFKNGEKEGKYSNTLLIVIIGANFTFEQHFIVRTTSCNSSIVPIPIALSF